MSNDHDLLAAYLDGIAELDPDERRRVDELLQSPGARADADATRDLIDQLRALPAEGHEPDWSVLERQIRAQVGAMPTRPWWRRARWLVPIGVLAATAAIALLWLRHPAPEPPVALVQPHVDAGAPATDPAPAAATALWLDGAAFDVGDVDPAVLDDSHDMLATEADTTDDLGILPVDDLGWIDTLDDKAIDRAERWLARKKG